MYVSYLKPFFDFICALLLLFLFTPLWLIVHISLWFANNGKVYFYQIRPGLHGEAFRIIKFKTMTDAKDKDGKLLPDEDRLTFMGTICRKTSLDELPQLVNVLKGDLSLVGPRPLLMSYLPLYSKEQARRHDVKPGITGWAQVNGRNTIAWKDKFELDLFYVDNIGFALDVKIFFKTIINVFTAKDVSLVTTKLNDTWYGNKE
ncbi:sugar transferase [Labilibaculum antarcticum]|uniref:UDP-galactose phosphate transferase n=1 Tax=Labilibaculum antarcticum TaxID=1717717 RepID=A0A1Y1CQB5_9BACT|nr:sugar transferase [Labilibaculum antarcticum]BAX82628.1 UDP-galactose phosphate transferase [Labilibaculum antarcticum]